MPDRLRILHVEDLRSDAEMVHRVLEKSPLQFEKKVVDNRLDFENSLERFNPDIILSDHSLPSFDSHEALTIVNTRRLHIPFILVTATVSEEYAVNIMKEGACDYVLKDRLQRLPNAIAGAIEKFRMERAAQEEKERQVLREQKLLTETSIRVQEREREEIGVELHDNINQVLSSAKMYFETAYDESGRNVLLEKGLTHLRNAMEEIRKLSHRLVAPELTKISLVQAIANLAQNSRETGSLHLQYETANFTEERVSNEIRLALYRIVQEQFNNILKHAKAKNVLIMLDMTSSTIFLTIRDDGRGFDSSVTRYGIGLRNITNRVKL
ncbi:MAG: response regulator, partial [Chitinophagaceae bacterium]|nr:response regulator [Chitinophagaceae bacterium]